MLVKFEPYVSRWTAWRFMQVGASKPPDTNMIMLAYYISIFKMLLDVLHSWRSFWLFHKRPLLCWSLVFASFILIMVIRRFLAPYLQLYPKLVWRWNDAFVCSIGRIIISYKTKVLILVFLLFVIFCYVIDIVYKDAMYKVILVYVFQNMYIRLHASPKTHPIEVRKIIWTKLPLGSMINFPGTTRWAADPVINGVKYPWPKIKGLAWRL